MNIYPFRRPDVKMTEKRSDVNRKIGGMREECSGKMKMIHDAVEAMCITDVFFLVAKTV